MDNEPKLPIKAISYKKVVRPVARLAMVLAGAGLIFFTLLIAFPSELNAGPIGVLVFVTIVAAYVVGRYNYARVVDWDLKKIKHTGIRNTVAGVIIALLWMAFSQYAMSEWVTLNIEVLVLGLAFFISSFSLPLFLVASRKTKEIQQISASNVKPDL